MKNEKWNIRQGKTRILGNKEEKKEKQREKKLYKSKAQKIPIFWCIVQKSIVPPSQPQQHWQSLSIHETGEREKQDDMRGKGRQKNKEKSRQELRSWEFLKIEIS